MTWILTAISIAGVILNIKHNRICFILWIISNGFWVIIDFQKKIPAQGFLFLIYFGLAVWGLFAWKKRK